MSSIRGDPWQGILPSGREVAVTGMSKTVIPDGEIQENRVYFDSQEMLAQLGATDE